MKYWKRIDKEGKTITVESYSHNLNVNDAIEITKQEYDKYISSLPKQIKRPKIYYKTKFQNATTTDEKIQIIAEKLGLI